MKNLFIILLFTQLVNAQIQPSARGMYSPPKFLTSEPTWHYTVFDSTNIGNLFNENPDYITDGYNSTTYIRPWTWQPVLEDHYLYGYTTTLGTTSYIYGAMVYKINMLSGKLEWIEVFDNRHSDRQEYVQSIEIKDDTVELVTMKRYDSPEHDLVPYAYNLFGADSYACIRKYSKIDGSLLKYECWDKEDTATIIVAPHSKSNRIFEKRIDGNYLYLVSRINTKKHIELYIIDKNGHLEYEQTDTMYYPKEKYDRDKIDLSYPEGKMRFLENDTVLVGYNYNYNNGIGRFLQNDLSYIQMYNKEFDPIGRLDLGKFVDMYEKIYDISIRYADDKYIVLYIYEQSDYHVAIIDYDGNIICIMDHEQNPKEFLLAGGGGYLKYSQKPIKITRSYNDQYPRELPQTLNYYVYENGNWEKKFSQKMGENCFINEIRYMIETPSKDVLICADYKYYNEDLDVSCLGTDMWMLIDGEKLGIKTLIDKELIEENVNIYPNPTSGKINIVSSKNFDYVCVFDVTGKVIFRKPFTNTISVDNLKEGFYIIELIDKKGRACKTKLVKK